MQKPVRRSTAVPFATLLCGGLLAALLLYGSAFSDAPTMAQQDQTQPAQGGKRVPAAKRLKLLKTFVSEFVDITPGQGQFPQTFSMGSRNGQPSERPVRTVTMSSDFAIARYEVPQNLYEAVMGENPSRWTGPRNSAEMMSWQEAVLFCKRITQLLRSAELINDNEVIRLPTEAEWEYCCRAGTSTAYSFGDKATKLGDRGKQASRLDAYGWHTGNAAGNDPPVGALKPNPWGLYDMHGYLWEFVADAWHPNYNNAPKTPDHWKVDDEHFPLRVMRGGSWRDHYRQLRCAARIPIPEHAKSDAVGFRCVKSRVPK